MSLATTTSRLERLWQREQRLRPPWTRWADTAPALAGDPDELRATLADRDRRRSGPALAALVELARHGDDQAALLVTLTLLPRMVMAEAKHRSPSGGDGGYDQLAGLLWEAVVTAPNSQVAALRESIERNVWRRKWRSDRPIAAVELDVERARPGPGGDPADVAVAHLHVDMVLTGLETGGSITPATRRLLQSVAAGDEHPGSGDGRSVAAVRKQRWRTMTRLRHDPAVVAALTA